MICYLSATGEQSLTAEPFLSVFAGGNIAVRTEVFGRIKKFGQIRAARFNGGVAEVRDVSVMTGNLPATPTFFDRAVMVCRFMNCAPACQTGCHQTSRILSISTPHLI